MNRPLLSLLLILWLAAGFELWPRVLLAQSAACNAVGQLRVSGNSEIEAHDILRISGLRSGSEVCETDLMRTKENILTFYRDQGYLDATVDIQQQVDRAGISAIEFVVTEGDPTLVEQIEFEGSLPEDVQPLLPRMREVYLKRIASRATFRSLTMDLLLGLRREGYLQASARVREARFEPLLGGVRLFIALDARNPITIYFNGNTVFTPEELLSPLKLETRTVPFSPNAVGSLTRDIERIYQERGYYYAQATAEALPPEGSRQIFRITIVEGEQYRLGNILFEGNKTFSRSQLKELLISRVDGQWIVRRWFPGYLTSDSINEDVATLTGFYVARGFRAADVRFSLAETSSHTLTLTFSITEGEPTYIEAISLRFHDAATERFLGSGGNDVLKIIPKLKVGERYDEDVAEAERALIASEVAALGYPRTKVTTGVELKSGTESTPGAARLVYEIESGNRVRVGEIEIAGNKYTRNYVIRRMVKLEPGGLWRTDLIRKSEQSLYASGIFQSVNIHPADTLLDSEQEDLRVDVVERDTGTIGGTVAFNTDDGLHLRGELAQRNLGGRGDSLVLGADSFVKTGNQLLDAAEARAVFSRPNIFSSEAVFLSEAFIEHDLELMDQFSFDRVGASVSLSEKIAPKLKGTIGYTLFNENLFDVEPDVQIQDIDSGTSFYSLLRAEVELDERDDSFNPRRGYRTVAQFRVSGDFLGSEVNVVGGSWQHSQFVSLAGDLVWANNVRFQLLRPYGDTEAIPISHRVFLGGRNSLRGFSVGAVGPRGGEGNIVGGDTALNASTELQYDLTPDVIGAVFLDAGQSILEDVGTFDGDPLDFGDMRFSPGLGIRYRTPIGPLSVDYGFALDREFGERFGRLNIALGGSF